MSPAPSTPSAYPPGSVGMRPMLDALARNWGWILVRGIVAILFGLLTFAWPGLTLLTLVAFYGAFALVDGVSALVAAFTNGPPAPRWWLGLIGLVGIAAGILTLLYPGMTGIILLMFIASWAVVSGVLQIAGAISMRKEIEGEWFLILSGILSVVFGVLMFAYPGPGALGLAIAIGAFAIATGILQVAFALRLRKMAQVRI